MPALHPIGQLDPESRPPEKRILFRPDAVGIVLAIVVVGALCSSPNDKTAIGTRKFGSNGNKQTVPVGCTTDRCRPRTSACSPRSKPGWRPSRGRCAGRVGSRRSPCDWPPRRRARQSPFGEGKNIFTHTFRHHNVPHGNGKKFRYS